MRRVVVSVINAAVLCLVASPLGAVTLADLLANPATQIVVGDKIFTNFTGGNISCTNTCTGSFSTITVTGGTFNGLLGLDFSGNISVGGGGLASSQDIKFEYDVIVNGNQATDIHMDMNGSLIPSFGQGGQFFVTIQETVTNLNAPGGVIGNISVIDHPNSNLSVSANLDTASNHIHVTKDMLMSVNTVTVGTLSDFKQTFSQVPEPASIVLLGSLLSGFAFLKSRKSKTGVV